MIERYSYQSALAASETIHWRIEDIIGGEKRLNFDKPFMPESLARVESLNFLNKEEKRTLNQIRGHAYLSIFGLVEEFILPFVLDQARPQLQGDDYRTRALLEFAGEEAKHIQLFKRFRQEFQDGFGSKCEVIGPPEAIAKEILAHDPLAVAITTLHIEWMVQKHYLESIKDDQKLDPQFKSLLKHHWLEEIQHAKLDTLMIATLAADKSEEEILAGVEEYLAIGGFLDSGLAHQVELDLQSLERACWLDLSDEQKAEFRKVQLQANRWSYLGSGMTHPRVLETLGSLTPKARARVESVSAAFC
ncbi:MAG TPA: diiron oxygenase [Pyrinomonadaceae bacterium]|nr:diiron oxygenase [Pyrinomonadaceae bacterium]